MADDPAEEYEEHPGILSGLGTIPPDAPQSEVTKIVHAAEDRLSRVYRDRVRAAAT